jgi:hypothetical protein
MYSCIYNKGKPEDDQLDKSLYREEEECEINSSPENLPKAVYNKVK